MTDNIKPLFPGQPVPGTANANTVALLEHILGRAKSGEITEVALAGWTSDNASITCFTHGGRAELLMGALVRLTARIERTMEDGE